MNTGGKVQAIGAHNFYKVLGLIDRTIIPRRLVLFNGVAEISLLVARKRACIESGNSEAVSSSVESTAATLAGFCAAERAVEHRLEPIPSAPTGYPVTDIVNAQERGRLEQNADNPRHYEFACDGWPLVVPPAATFDSIVTAMQIAQAMDELCNQSAEWLESPTLIVAVSEELAEDVSVSAGQTLTVATTPPGRLGSIISSWRNRTDGDGNTGRGA